MKVIVLNWGDLCHTCGPSDIVSLHHNPHSDVRLRVKESAETIVPRDSSREGLNIKRFLKAKFRWMRLGQPTFFLEGLPWEG